MRSASAGARGALSESSDSPTADSSVRAMASAATSATSRISSRGSETSVASARRISGASSPSTRIRTAPRRRTSGSDRLPTSRDMPTARLSLAIDGPSPVVGGESISQIEHRRLGERPAACGDQGSEQNEIARTTFGRKANRRGPNLVGRVHERLLDGGVVDAVGPARQDLQGQPADLPIGVEQQASDLLQLAIARAALGELPEGKAPLVGIGRASC